MTKVSAHYVEVCDIPYCSEPSVFYQRRIKAGLQVMALREKACRLFDKQDHQLTLRDLKLAFLNLYPIKINLGGDDHEVTVKRVSGLWVLSCNCRSWIFSLRGKRSCKHTDYIETLMAKEEERWGIKKDLDHATVADDGRSKPEGIGDLKQRKEVLCPHSRKDLC